MNHRELNKLARRIQQSRIPVEEIIEMPYEPIDWANLTFHDFRDHYCPPSIQVTTSPGLALAWGYACPSYYSDTYGRGK